MHMYICTCIVIANVYIYIYIYIYTEYMYTHAYIYIYIYIYTRAKCMGDTYYVFVFFLHASSHEVQLGNSSRRRGCKLADVAATTRGCSFHILEKSLAPQPATILANTEPVNGHAGHGVRRRLPGCCLCRRCSKRLLPPLLSLFYPVASLATGCRQTIGCRWRCTMTPLSSRCAWHRT